MISTTTIIAIANAITLLFGGTITYLAWRAYRRTDARALRAMTIGIGLVTLGMAIGGSLHQFTDTELLTAVALQSSFVALGFAVLAYSLSRTAAPAPPRQLLTRSR